PSSSAACSCDGPAPAIVACGPCTSQRRAGGCSAKSGRSPLSTSNSSVAASSPPSASSSSRCSTGSQPSRDWPKGSTRGPPTPIPTTAEHSSGPGNCPTSLSASLNPRRLSSEYPHRSAQHPRLGLDREIHPIPAAFVDPHGLRGCGIARCPARSLIEGGRWFKSSQAHKSARDQRKRWSLRLAGLAQLAGSCLGGGLWAPPLPSRSKTSEQPRCGPTVVGLLHIVGCIAVSELILAELWTSVPFEMEGDPQPGCTKLMPASDGPPACAA